MAKKKRPTSIASALNETRKQRGRPAAAAASEPAEPSSRETASELDEPARRPRDPKPSRNTRIRFEQWAQNPTCCANAMSAVHNIRMADVATREGLPNSFGQSPFAIARGMTFERMLLLDEGKRLREELILKDVLPEDAAGFEDYRIRLNGGPLRDLEAAIEATEDLIGRAARRESLPCLVSAATVKVPSGVMLPEAILILDALAIRGDGDWPDLIVGEVKTYPDRGGHTDSHQLATARAQAGLYVHALQLLVEELGLTDLVRVRTDGFLVLSRPGSNLPSVRAGEDFRYQAARAQRGFEILERAALGLPPFDPVGDDPIAAVAHAETDYGEACVGFCDLAERCQEAALEAGNPTVLGDDVKRFVGSIGLFRAMELMRGAAPADAAEDDLVRRIADSDWTAAEQ